MNAVTDEQIQELATTGKPYSLVQLWWAPGRHQQGAESIELEHQRRMVSLRAEGTIAVLCPVLSEGLCGVAIMTETVDQARHTMAADPCVRAGMMTVEVLPCVGFPGDSLPG
jgi:negative regulator of sigma E activity